MSLHHGPDQARVSEVARELRAGLAQLGPPTEAAQRAEAHARSLRRFVQRHPAADLYVLDPEGAHAPCTASGPSTPERRGALPFLPEKAAAECRGYLERRSRVNDYLLAVSVAMVAGEHAAATHLVRDGLIQHGHDGPAAQLRQWSALLLHLRGEAATPVFLELMGSPIAPVRHAALASGALIAVAEGADAALDRMLDAMGDEDPARQVPALMRVVELQSRRRGATVVQGWFQRLRRRSERRAHTPDWAFEVPTAPTASH